MHGDFSRGHEPDRKRGHRYRRVLLQMGRPVLDSDVAASVDAVLGEVRTATRGLGCEAGSPDLGFLVSAGRLLAVFAEAADGVRVTAGAPQVWRDHRSRLLDRFPALFVGAAGGRTARVTLPLLQAVRATTGSVALWASVRRAVTIRLDGVAVDLRPTGRLEPVRVGLAAPTGATGRLEVEVPAGGEVWLHLLEEDEDGGRAPAFWIAPGTYHVDGLVVDAGGGGPFPEQGFPESAGFPWSASPAAEPPLAGLLMPPLTRPGTPLVAYLEVHERHLTAVEDPGVHEEALGPGDTCTRTELVGQVKLAGLARAMGADAVREAFTRIEPSGAELTVSVASSTPVLDPCALPDVAGYAGADNRLYRIEVHHGGPLGQLRLKWSRDNGSELFAARLDLNGSLVFPAGTTLAAGDLVEVLSHVVDLGDARSGELDVSGFVPPTRAVGQLAQLAPLPVASSSDEVAFALVDPDDTSTPVTLDDRYGQLPEARLKVRRWHGIVDPRLLAGTDPVSPGPHPLEDGITVTLSRSGFYRPGQYWQYEARVRQENANGPWRSEPHGPPRWFAPLALLEFAGDDQPVDLVAWLDTRFSPSCGLGADDISYDGDRVGTASDTVQEALDELFERSVSWPVVDKIGWRNDRPLSLSDLEQVGLAVTFSEEMHPAGATPDTFIVTVEAPDEPGNGLFHPLVLDGRVAVDGPTWTFVPNGQAHRQLSEWIRAAGRPLRGRVRLAGDVILDRSGERPLDGEAVGRIAVDGYDTFLDLRLPSGDGTRGGDFHSWFYLTTADGLIRVEAVEPPDRAVVEPGEVPAVVLVNFSEPVRFASLDRETFVVSRVREGERADAGEPIEGTLQPYPFEAEPDLVTGVTFVPDDPDAFRPAEPGATSDVAVLVRGAGDRAVVGPGDRAVDGAGRDAPSDFTSTFRVQGPEG